MVRTRFCPCSSRIERVKFQMQAETQELYFDFLHKGDRRHRLMELAAKESAQSLRKVRLPSDL